MSLSTRRKSRKSTPIQAEIPASITVASSRRRARATNRKRDRSLRKRIPSPARIWSQFRLLAKRCLPGLLVATCLALFLGTGYAGYRWFTESPRFAITELQLRGNQEIDHSRVQELLALAPNANIFRTDMDSLESRLVADPWISSAQVNRSFPNGIEIEIQEESASAAVELDGLYLVNASGQLFKRADVDAGEVEGLSIITGLGREAYLQEREESSERLVYALAALGSYHANPKRPRLGEVHLDQRHGITLITYENAIAIHLGSPDNADFDDRYRSFDSAWSALDSEEHAAARAFRIADRTPSDQVTIAFAGN